MSNHHYTKSLPFDNWSQDYVVNEIDKEHLQALYNLCRQCCIREVQPEELQPYLITLEQDNEKVGRLGRSLIKSLGITNQGLRYDSVMGGLEGIFNQVGKL